ncbi:MAG: HDIG domain-containing protein [Acidobacteria bacterium]|nr:HDIG domain-containing protein [Acidobacteriota bacterium]MBI3426588.1 HDIG domain-containing protein [Acidobacteriota bacterium]
MPTAFLCTHFPFTLLPSYAVNDTVLADIIVPADLQADSLDAFSNDLAPEIAAELRHTRVILRAGDAVTAQTLPQIKAIRQYQLSQRQPRRFLGLIVIVAALYFALYKIALASKTSRLGPRAAFWVAASLLLLQTFLVRAGMFGAAVLSARPETMRFGDALIFQFAVPFAVCALVLALLINSQIALIAGLMAALLTGFVSAHGMTIAAFAMATSITAVFSVQNYCDRNSISYASASIGGVSFVMSLAVLLMSGHALNWRMLAGSAVVCALSALLTAGLASFLVPIYESVFDILTDVRLLELSNADLPLLRRLAIEVPGTNHHSFMVGVLAEAAAKAIGANALLARVGCLYHDIGKLAAPRMYIENQAGAANPHDKVTPKDSARIITGHVRRGIEMGNAEDLPPQIIDFIPQHHGTRVIAYFYHKAKAEADRRGEAVNVEDFRYPGPKPQSKEAAILMLADGAEASVRSLEDRSEENIRAIIKKIIDTVVADGQFDECSLTMRELTLVRESLISTLQNVYHQRISYPGFNPPSKAEREITQADLKNPPPANGDDDPPASAAASASNRS